MERTIKSGGNGETTPETLDTLRAKLQEGARKIQTLSELVSRANLAYTLGYSYEDSRNLYQALGYKNTLVYNDYYQQFLRQDIAQAVINRPVKVSWSGPLTIVEAKEDEETNLEKDWLDLERRLKLKYNFIRLDKLTGLGCYGVLLLGFDDIKKTSDFITPVKKGKRKLLYVRPLGEPSATISKWVSDVGDERYGLPLIYDVVLTNPDGGKQSTMKVHHTRVLHVVDSPLESETSGLPRLQVVFNRLQDLEKLVGGSAEMFWRGARPGYRGLVDKEHTLGTAEETALREQLDEYEHNLRRFLIMQGVDLQALEMQIADPKNHVDVQMQMISAVTGIPKRILSGSERGELASTQDAAEWVAFVQARREEFTEPQIIRPFVDRMIEYGVLPSPSEGYDIEWADLFAISEKDKAEIGRIRATALREYFVNPLTPELVPLKAFYEFFLGFNRQQVELINEIPLDNTVREIREHYAKFQSDIKQESMGNGPSAPGEDKGAKPTADDKTKDMGT